MSKIVNLRQARKHKARDDKRRQGTANAVTFGQSKAARTRDAADAQKQRDWVEGHRLHGHQDDPDV